MGQGSKPYDSVWDAADLFRPFAWKKPRMIRVESGIDIFCESASFDYLDKVFAVMALTPQHTYQIVTENPGRAAEYFAHRERVNDISIDLADDDPAWRPWTTYDRVVASASPFREQGYGRIDGAMIGIGWPLRNVWIGVPVENQEQADKRTPELLRVPAAVRFLSMEPSLGPVTIKLDNFGYWSCPECGNARDFDNASPFTFRDREGVDDDVICHGELKDGSHCDYVGPMQFHRHLHWVVVGGESGPGSRPLHPDWVRSIRNQCQAAGVPFYFQGWGEWLSIGGMNDGESDRFYVSNKKAPEGEEWKQSELDECYGSRCIVETKMVGFDGVARAPGDAYAFYAIDGHGAYQAFRVGKKAAGRRLDGREWNEIPRESH